MAERSPVPSPVLEPNTDNLQLTPSDYSPLPASQSCPQELESKSTTQTCDVTHQSASQLVYIEGTLLTVEGPIEKGGVLFEKSGKIVCTGCDCRAKAEDATRISCPQGIISPGLINAHDHLGWGNGKPSEWKDERFEHRHDWRGGGRSHSQVEYKTAGTKKFNYALGELRQLMVGTTSIAGSSGIQGFLRNLDEGDQLEGLKSGAIRYNTFPLGDNEGNLLLTNNCKYPSMAGLKYAKNKLNLFHVSEGIDSEARNEFLCLSSSDREGIDVTDTMNTYIHAIGLIAPDAAKLANAGTAVVWSPRTNVSLYGNTAPVTLFRNLGVTVALGTDWLPSGSAHLGRELQCAAHLSEKYFDKQFNDYDLWIMSTASAASAMKFEKEIGRLAPNFIADISVYRKAEGLNVYRSIFTAEAKATALVLRGGVPLYGDKVLLEGLNPSCATAVSICGEDKLLCFDSEAKSLDESDRSFANFIDDKKTLYPLYFCEAPASEPSCDPVRQKEYTAIVADDRDGDGLSNGRDNCPFIFNPIRPVDKGFQADSDRDGQGDACDLCPSGSSASCRLAELEDRDHDLKPDYRDNCPFISNPLQEDSDSDGTGDSCDNCPRQANLEGAACVATSIKQLKASLNMQGSADAIPLNADVTVKGIVTFINDSGFTIQDNDAGAAGIFVYKPKVTGLDITPTKSNEVTITGNFQLYYDEPQITLISPIKKVAIDRILPRVLTAEEALNLEILSSLVGTYVSYKGKVKALLENDQRGDYKMIYTIDSLTVGVNDKEMKTLPKVDEELTLIGVVRKSKDGIFLEIPKATTGQSNGAPKLQALAIDRQYFVLQGSPSSELVPPIVLSLDKPAVVDMPVVLESADGLQLPAGAAPIIASKARGVTLTQLDTSLASAGRKTLTIHVGDQSTNASITILEKAVQPKMLPLSEKDAAVQASLNVPGTIRVNMDVPNSLSDTFPLEVVSSDSSIVEVVGESVLKPQALFAEISIKAKAVGTASLTVTYNGTSLVYSVQVQGQGQVTQEPDLMLNEVLYDAVGDDTGLEWIEIRNSSGRRIDDLSAYSIGAGGGKYTNSVYGLSGKLEKGACLVVGLNIFLNLPDNAVSVAALPVPGAPKFTLQNGGAFADAVAIFHLPYTAVKDDSIPLDALVYGSTNNKDNFKGAGGKDFPVDQLFKQTTPGQSMIRKGASWGVNENTPVIGDCGN